MSLTSCLAGLEGEMDAVERCLADLHFQLIMSEAKAKKHLDRHNFLID